MVKSSPSSPESDLLKDHKRKTPEGLIEPCERWQCYTHQEGTYEFLECLEGQELEVQGEAFKREKLRKARLDLHSEIYRSFRPGTIYSVSVLRGGVLHAYSVIAFSGQEAVQLLEDYLLVMEIPYDEGTFIGMNTDVLASPGTPTGVMELPPVTHEDTKDFIKSIRL